MPNVEKLLMFLASPSDVPQERQYVKEIVANLNGTVIADKGLTLEVVSWENSTVPGYGQDAQALINAQIAEMARFALFVGIMWNRIGTRTPRGVSGTVEEFERAAEALTQKTQPDIWFYFRQSASTLDTHEQLEQRGKVLEFKNRVQQKGFIAEYSTAKEFQKTFRDHLILWLNKRARKPETRWVAVNCKPTPLELMAPFRIGPTEARSPVDGAAGCVAIPPPPGVTKVLRLRVAGQRNDGVIKVELYRGGWDPIGMDHEKSLLLRLEFPPSDSFVHTWPPANSPEALELGKTIDSQYHTLSLVIEVTNRTSISLIAVEFGYEVEV